MNRFSFLETISLQELEELETRETLVKNFLLEKSINILWGRSGLGKTWLCMGLCKMLARNGCDIVYLDADNGIDILKDRGYDKVIKELSGSMTYINADFMDDAKAGMDKVFSQLEDNAKAGYKRAIFIMDSLTFFLNGNVYDEIKINNLIRFTKRLRRAGGTLIIIAHSTKTGEVLRGSSNLTNAVDEVWKIRTTPARKGEINYICEPEKKRLDVSKCAFNVVLNGCEISVCNPSKLDLDEMEGKRAEEIKELLSKKSFTQSNLLKQIGLAKNDRRALKLLKKLDGILWQSKKGANNSICYTLI